MLAYVHGICTSIAIHGPGYSLLGPRLKQRPTLSAGQPFAEFAKPASATEKAARDGADCSPRLPSVVSVLGAHQCTKGGQQRSAGWQRTRQRACGARRQNAARNEDMQTPTARSVFSMPGAHQCTKEADTLGAGRQRTRQSSLQGSLLRALQSHPSFRTSRTKLTYLTQSSTTRESNEDRSCTKPLRGPTR